MDTHSPTLKLYLNGKLLFWFTGSKMGSTRLHQNGPKQEQPMSHRRRCHCADRRQKNGSMGAPATHQLFLISHCEWVLERFMNCYNSCLLKTLSETFWVTIRDYHLILVKNYRTWFIAHYFLSRYEFIKITNLKWCTIVANITLSSNKANFYSKQFLVPAQFSGKKRSGSNFGVVINVINENVADCLF